MNLNTLYFMFVFLPIALILYYIVPKKLKNAVLVLESFVFYAWGNPVTLILLLLSLAFNYVVALEIDVLKDTEKQPLRKVALLAGIVGNVLVLFAYKYTGFLLDTINGLTGLSLSFSAKAAPIGLSFYTFTVLSYLIDVYTGKGPALRNPLEFGVYAAFFPKLLSGPIVKYEEFGRQLQDHPVSREKAFSGVNLFLVGLFKKVLLADKLGTLFSAITGTGALSPVSAMLGAIFYTLQLYFDFSGYSDMAIGLSSLFGFEIAPNFDHPYLSQNISEFWRRWHISLGAWFRNYIYIPLGGNRCDTSRVILNLSVVWLLTGLWHGADWSFLLWGIYHGFFVALERFVIKEKMDFLPRRLRIVITFIIVALGWIPFFSANLSDTLHYFSMFFGSAHVGFLDQVAKYYIATGWPLLLAAFIGCTTIPHTLHQKLVYKAGNRNLYISIVCYVILFVICIAALVSSTYSSFLYVQF